MFNRGSIYFDGGLPDAKKEERLDRVRQISTVASNYFSATTSGISANSSKLNTQTLPSPKVSSNKTNGQLPAPSFLVPVVLDAIRASKYGPLVHLVLGEADPYCAKDVRRNGGTILTSDSDLLLYDLDEEGTVMFYSDLDTAGTRTKSYYQSLRLEGLVYRQSTICSRLSLEAGQSSLLSFAFEMKMDYHRTLESWLSRAKRKQSATTHTKEWNIFASQYQDNTGVYAKTPDYMAFLDPRVSEFVQCCQAGNSAIMYLPLLLDRWDQASAWNPSIPIRQVAYSVCALAGSARMSVAEYRRTLSNASKGQSMDLLRNDSQIHSAIQSLLDQINMFILPGSQPSRLQWLSLALAQEVPYAADEGSESLTLRLWRKASKVKGHLDPGNWDVLHLTAQVQGVLYSFRMLQQVLQCREVWAAYASSSLGAVLSNLEVRLGALLAIADFPTALETADLFEQLHKAGLLGKLALHVGLSEPFTFGESGRKAQRKRKHQEIESGRAKSKGTTNPFDVLSGEM